MIGPVRMSGEQIKGKHKLRALESKQSKVCPVCYREHRGFVPMVEGRCPKAGEHRGDRS